MSEMKVTRMSPAQALSMARPDRVLRYDRFLGAGFDPKPLDSFQLKDGRYAFKVYDDENDCDYYAVYDGLPEKTVAELDAYDHQWMLKERYKAENESFASIGSDMYGTDVESEIVSPFDRKSYTDWFAKEMAADIEEEAAMNPEHEIIRMFVASLSPDERRLFELLFDTHMTTEEIMEEMGISTKQALSNRKARLLEKIRKVFRAAGYQVPTAKELRAEKKAAREKSKKQQ